MQLVPPKTDRHPELTELLPRLRSALVAAYGPAIGMDAASDAIEWALTNNDRLPEIDNLGGYLYRVGQTKARALLRPQPVPEAPMPPTIPMVEPQLPGALNALSETQRVCVVMVHALGYPQVEVAGMLGVSESTVRTHLRRALSTLRKELNVE